MQNLKQNLEKFAEKIHLRKGKIISLVFAVLAILVFILDATFFHGQLKAIFWGFDGIMLVVFLVSMILVAGFVVINSLFNVAAGLSLIIFLSQAYCASPNLTATSNNALKGLLVIGLIYVAVDFARILYKGLIKHLKTIEPIKSHLEKVLVIFLFLAFACIFVVAVYQVMSPIVLGLCVYH